MDRETYIELLNEIDALKQRCTALEATLARVLDAVPSAGIAPEAAAPQPIVADPLDGLRKAVADYASLSPLASMTKLYEMQRMAKNLTPAGVNPQTPHIIVRLRNLRIEEMGPGECVTELQFVAELLTEPPMKPQPAPVAGGDYDLPGDAVYGYCKHCNRSSVQVFDGKDWVCEVCGWGPTQPTAAPVAAAPQPNAMGGDEPIVLTRMLGIDGQVHLIADKDALCGATNFSFYQGAKGSFPNCNQCLAKQWDVPAPQPAPVAGGEATVCSFPNCWNKATHQIDGHWFCDGHDSKALLNLFYIAPSEPLAFHATTSTDQPPATAPAKAAPKLTARQKQTLEIVAGSKDGWAYGGRYGEVNANSAKSLVVRGFLAYQFSWDTNSFKLTDAGRAALSR